MTGRSVPHVCTKLGNPITDVPQDKTEKRRIQRGLPTSHTHTHTHTSPLHSKRIPCNTQPRPQEGAPGHPMEVQKEKSAAEYGIPFADGDQWQGTERDTLLARDLTDNGSSCEKGSGLTSQSCPTNGKQPQTYYTMYALQAFYLACFPRTFCHGTCALNRQSRREGWTENPSPYPGRHGFVATSPPPPFCSPGMPRE